MDAAYVPFREANSFYRNLYDLFAEWSFWGVSPIPDWLAYFLAGFLIIFAVVNAVVIVTTIGTWVERRLIGRFQSRIGPNRWGPFGPPHPRGRCHQVAKQGGHAPRGCGPVGVQPGALVFIVAPLLVFAVIPLGKNTYVANLNIGILFIIAVTTVPTIAMFMAGWGSGNRYSLFGAMRGVAQLVSYEVPMVLSIVGVLLLAGSLSLVDIVEAQDIPFLLIQPLGFFHLPPGHLGGNEPLPIRHSGGGLGAGGWVPHRVQRYEVGHLPACRIHRPLWRCGHHNHALSQGVGRPGIAVSSVVLP